MRALRLEVEGFGPYLTRQEVDFTAFDTDRLFVITGKTGAGKSTILDAITFALYGDVPRYDGTKTTARSHFCTVNDPTEVTLEFEVGADRYRISRSPEYERPKERGEGTTTEKPQARLWRWEGDWQPVAMAPREVGQEIGAIMQLSADQFLQVILLAQGRFAEFLQSGTDSRLKLLRSLFGTQRFEDVTAQLRDLARQRSRAVEAADAELAVLIRNAASTAGVEAPEESGREEWLGQVDDALRAAAGELAQASEAARERAETARTALSVARQQEEQRTRLGTARAKVMSLEADADRHREEVSRLDRARRAAPVAGPLEASESADARLAAARERRDASLTTARASEVLGLAWEGDVASADVASLRARGTDLASERGGLDGALAAEARVPALTAARDEAAAETARVREERDTVQAEADALPEREAKVRAERDHYAVAAARLGDLEEAVTRAAATLDAHDHLDELARGVGEAQEHELMAVAARTGAVDRHGMFVKRRLRSQAAHLAASLVEGEPCAVCGSAAHPSPARPSDGHVTDEEVDAAKAHADRAIAAYDAAHEATAAAEAALATAKANLGEATREDAQAALTTARQSRDIAAAAAGEKADREATLEALAAEAASLKERLAGLATAVEAAQARATESGSALEQAAAQVAEARGSFDSVAARAAALSAARELVDGLAAAAEAVADAERSARDARDALTRALADAGLTDAQTAREAVLPPGGLEELDARIVRYQEDLSGSRAVVAELESVALPPEPADLVGLEAASLDAEDASKAATRAASDAESRLTQFASLAAQYREKNAATAEARERHAAVDTLANTLEGKEPNERRMRLESFVLAARLEEIVAAANARLTTMSNGQYLLEYDDGAQYRNRQTGLELKVADAHTGRSRSTRSLSGGETFLASLALALGLAETVTAAAGGIQLDTIFIDEGFGSLDGDTLEIAMSTLDDLRDAGRTVGLISHVEAMKEAIPAKLEVTKAADGSSRVAVSAGVLA